MKYKKLKLLKLLPILLFSFVANAQTKLDVSPVRHLPIPETKNDDIDRWANELEHGKISVEDFKTLMATKSELKAMTSLLLKSVTAYRFVLPFAGYSPLTQQISTGIGYGWNKLHFVDSTSTWYTDLSIFGAIFVNGNITPSPYNFTSVGVGVGFLNDLIMIIPSYNLPDGKFDLKISFGLILK